MSNVIGNLFLLTFLMLGQLTLAGSPNLTTIQTRIDKPGGAPLEAASVNFRFTILDSVGTCVLYVEDYPNVNMTGSQGIASFNLGTGSKQFPVGSIGMHDVFNNSTPSFNCQAGGTYSPGATDRRQIVMQFNDGNGWQTLPQMAINSVYYSIYATRAEFLGSYPANDYLRVASLPTCSGSQVLTFNGTSFTCVTASSGGVTGLTVSSPLILSGSTSTPVLSLPAASATSGGYLTSADWTTFNNKASATLTSGQLYIGNSSNAATGVTVSGDATLTNTGVMTLANSGVAAGTYGSASAIPNLVIDAKGRVTSATSQAYQNATNVAKGVVQIGSNISLNSGVISVSSSDVTNALGYTPADAASGAFVDGGNSFPADATIGMNSNFGLILKTNNTPRLIVTNTGNVGIGTTTASYKLDVAGDVNITGNFKVNGVNIATGGGTVTSVAATSSSGNPIVISGNATSPTVGLPVASATANGYLSSADWTSFNGKSDGTSLNASNLSAGTIAAARFPALSGDVTSAAGSVTLSVDRIKGKAVVPVTYSAGQVLRYDGSNWVNSSLSMFDLRSTVTGTATFAAGCTSNQTLTWTAATDNLSCTNIALPASQISSGTIATARLGSGTADSTTYLRGDGSWVTLPAAQWGTSGNNLYSTGKVAVGNSTIVSTAALTVNGNISTNGNSVIMGDTSGNTRGTGVVDIQVSRSAATQVAASNGSIAVGINNTANGVYPGVALGYGNSAYSDFWGGAVAVGYLNTANGSQSVAIGSANNSNNYDRGTTIGNANTITGHNGIAIGSVNTAYTSALALGYNNSATTSGAIAIGNGITNSTANTLQIGPSNTAKIMIDSSGSLGVGTTTTSEKLTVAGNIGLPTANAKITGSTGLTFEQTGDTFGTVRLSLQNRTGVNGAMFEQAGSVDLVDFVFKGLSNQSNIRYENRGTSIVYGAPEFQIGPPTASGTYFVVSGTAVGVTNNRPLMVGPFIPNAQSAITISGPANVGQLIRANASQTADIFQAQNSAGGVLFNLTSSGNVGIGTTPGYKLDVNGDANIASASALRFGGTQVCTSSGCTASSDIRLKENIRPLKNSLEKILRVEGVDYDYRDKKKFSERHQIGVIAQQVEEIYPEVVVTDEKTGLKSVAYDHLVAPIIESIKTLYGYFKDLKDEQSQIRRELASKVDHNESEERFKKLEQENALLKAYICQKDPKASFCK